MHRGRAKAEARRQRKTADNLPEMRVTAASPWRQGVCTGAFAAATYAAADAAAANRFAPRRRLS